MGKAIPISALKTYAEALAHYHLQPESKFLNAGYFDRGTTLRRHVEMTATHHIGKESHDWERQAMIGLNADSEIEYGVADCDRAELAETLRQFIADVGERKAAAMLGISIGQLKAVAAISNSVANDAVTRKVAVQLPIALALQSKLRHDNYAELQQLSDDVERYGLREIARRLGIDALNLRRKLLRLSTKSADLDA